MTGDALCGTHEELVRVISERSWALMGSAYGAGRRAESERARGRLGSGGAGRVCRE